MYTGNGMQTHQASIEDYKDLFGSARTAASFGNACLFKVLYELMEKNPPPGAFLPPDGKKLSLEDQYLAVMGRSRAAGNYASSQTFFCILLAGRERYLPKELEDIETMQRDLMSQRIDSPLFTKQDRKDILCASYAPYAQYSELARVMIDKKINMDPLVAKAIKEKLPHNDKLRTIFRRREQFITIAAADGSPEAQLPVMDLEF
jgi:hypothetical protein